MGRRQGREEGRICGTTRTVILVEGLGIGVWQQPNGLNLSSVTTSLVADGIT